MSGGFDLLASANVQPPPGGEAVALTAEDGRRLRLGLWRGGARGLAFVAPGRTEFIEKHYETVAHLRERGFSVAVIDWRGQGLSDRLLPDPLRGYVDDFASFQRDLDAARAYLAKHFSDAPWVLLAHSMGGCIAARALMRQAAGAFDDGPRFKAAALSAPMLNLHGGVSYLAAMRIAAAIMVGVNRDKSYTPGPGPVTLVQQGFNDNVLTTDPVRFSRFAEIVNAHPELMIAGATWGWLDAAIHEIAALQATATPVYLSVGLKDTVVSIDAVKAYAAANPANRFQPLDKALHEPLMETDDIQATFWGGFDAFLREQDL